MTREGVEKLHSSAAWADAYRGFLAAHQAAGHGVPYAVALAEQDADAALVEAETAEAGHTAAVAAARARLTARDAEERAQAEAKPDAAQEALARAVARMNASRGVTHSEGQDAALAQHPPQGDRNDPQVPRLPADMSPAARAVAAINSRR